MISQKRSRTEYPQKKPDGDLTTENSKKIRDYSQNTETSIEEDENKEYVIEKILARRIRNNKIEYNVKWKEFDYKDNTWEPIQHLIEEYCFEKLFDYENMTIEQKIELLNKYKQLKGIKNISQNSLRNSENHKDVINLKNQYREFNPLLKDKMDKWEYGNLNDDVIDEMFMCQKDGDEDVFFKCYWKTRNGEKKPRLPRIYHYSIIKSIDKENFHKVFYHFG